MNDLDEFRDEYLTEKAAKDAVAKAEAEKAQAEQEAREREEQIAREKAALAIQKARVRPIYEGILEALKVALAAPEMAEKKMTVSLDENNRLMLHCAGTEIKLYYWLELRQEYSGDAWKRKPTDKYRLTVGKYGDRQSFPQRKDGSFKYEEIARRLLQDGWAAVREKQVNAIRSANEAAAKAFRDANPMVKQFVGTVTANASTNSEKPIFLKFEWHAVVTPERAQAIFNALKLAGLIKDDGE